MRSIYLAALMIVLAGCASVGVTPMARSAPRAHNCNLDIYLHVQEIKGDYTTLCLIDARTGTSGFDDKSVSGAIKLARPKACECGADAIVVESANVEGPGLTGWGHGTAIIRAVKYKSLGDSNSH